MFVRIKSLIFQFLHESIIKYSFLRKSFLIIGIIAYLAYSFQMEILDGLHVLSHQLSGGYTQHTHHIDKETKEHQHQLLSKLKNVFSDQHKTPITQQKKLKYSIVDKFHHGPFNDPSIVWEERSRKLFINDNKIPASPFLQVITPPPQAIIKG